MRFQSQLKVTCSEEAALQPCYFKRWSESTTKEEPSFPLTPQLQGSWDSSIHPWARSQPPKVAQGEVETRPSYLLAANEPQVLGKSAFWAQFPHLQNPW